MNSTETYRLIIKEDGPILWTYRELSFSQFIKGMIDMLGIKAGEYNINIPGLPYHNLEKIHEYIQLFIKNNEPFEEIPDEPKPRPEYDYTNIGTVNEPDMVVSETRRILPTIPQWELDFLSTFEHDKVKLISLAISSHTLQVSHLTPLLLRTIAKQLIPYQNNGTTMEYFGLPSGITRHAFPKDVKDSLIKHYPLIVTKEDFKEIKS